MRFAVVAPVAAGVTADPVYMSAFAEHLETCGFESLVVVEHTVLMTRYTSVYPYDPSGRVELPADGPVKVVREDPVNPRMLWAGTEFGLYLTLDRGRHWMKFGGLPTVAVDDILLHPRDRDLVVATHGRSLYVLDDVRPLEEFTPQLAAKDAHLFAPRAATAYVPNDGWVTSAGSAVFRGANPTDGATISYYIRRLTGDPVSISIANAAGQPVATLTGAATPGINRVTWDLKPTKDVLTEYGGEGQKFVRPGDYTVTLSYGAVKQTATLHVEAAAVIETR